jgi:hypothetical protein
MEVVMQRQTTIRLAAIVALAGLTACSGGSPSSPTPQNPGIGGGGTPPQASTMEIAITESGGSFQLPPVPGFNGTMTVRPGTVQQSARLTLTGSTTDPAPGGGLLSKLRSPKSTGFIGVRYYLVITPDVGISFTTIPGFTVTLPSSVNVTTGTGQFFYALSTSPISVVSATPNPTATPNYNYNLVTEGPATVDGHTLTFDEAPNPVTFLAGDTYILVFYVNCTLPSGATSC